MSIRSVLITGATGCIGQYVLDALLPDGIQIHALLRNPTKLPLRYHASPLIQIHQGDMVDIASFKALTTSVDAVIHLATHWQDHDLANKINITETHRLLEDAASGACQKIIYFSTASILGADNRPLPEALTDGTAYIRSKYQAFQKLANSPAAEKTITFFPTMVLGGDLLHPYSHISGGILETLNWLNLVRFFTIDTRFHFLHAQDIAALVRKILFLPYLPEKRDFVLGNPVVSGEAAIETLCRIFGKKRYLKIRLDSKRALGLAKLFQIQMSSWDHFCIQNPFFEYQVTSPADFSLPVAFPTLESVLTRLQADSRG